MKVEMVMPQMGESVAEGTIVKWNKSVGDHVELDEDILEISTDKVDSEIPSPIAGTIVEILVQEGETVPIKTLLAVIEAEGEVAQGPTEVPPAGSEPARPSAQESSPHDASDHGGLQVKVFRRSNQEAQPAIIPTGNKSTFISPLVQNIAAEAGIRLSEIQELTGSGRDGRVTKKDILLYISERGTSPTTLSPTEAKTAAPIPVSPGPTTSTPVGTAAPAVWSSPTDEIFEMDRMRKMIADHMVRSVQTSPHVVSYSEVDLSRIVKHRESIKKTFREREGIKITYTSYFLYLTARALQEFPYVNASVDGYKVILRKRINLGFAVELPGSGLIVPVIKNVDNLNLKGVAHGLHELAEKARAGNLAPDDVSGGTFTVTNVGVFGNIAGAPIINQPQVAILGVGAIRKIPSVIETPDGDTIGIRSKMIMSLSYDHRLIDGAMAGRFMARLAQLMEQFEE